MSGSARVGLVGCGSWGRNILRDLLSLGCSVSAVARSPESRARAEDADTTVASVSKLPDVDGIVIATPTTTHAAVIDEALERGVPVFVEKPLTNDLIAADQLAATAGERLFVMDKWRYHPGVELLRDLAHDGSLGAVRGLLTTRVGWGNPHDDVDAAWVLAPHDLSIALEILGELPRARAAVADLSGDEVQGLVGLLGERPWHRLEVSVRSPERRREVQLVCEDGVALLANGYSEHVLLHRDDADEPERREIATELPLRRELRAFVEHLQGGPPPRSSAAEGALVVRRIAELRALAGAPA
ncbi:MAG TPA: Gfo/Idh/MocA family oxidoreductase [Gaiellaceae bacterium]|nr:Gfo/Idh/MocA family oxidoreductase [Gaiellaceae bacterium]